MAAAPFDFIRDFSLRAAPDEAVREVRRCLLDLLRLVHAAPDDGGFS